MQRLTKPEAIAGSDTGDESEGDRRKRKGKHKDDKREGKKQKHSKKGKEKERKHKRRLAEADKPSTVPPPLPPPHTRASSPDPYPFLFALFIKELSGHGQNFCNWKHQELFQHELRLAKNNFCNGRCIVFQKFVSCCSENCLQHRINISPMNVVENQFCCALMEAMAMRQIAHLVYTN